MDAINTDHPPARENPAPQPQSPQPYDGATYYGRPQLKPWPFNEVWVGGYIFLAGLSGASALIGAMAQARGGTEPGRAALVRRARFLALPAITLGPVLLIADLHTPKRFYNMLRIARKTSPMSIGTWTLMGFSGFAGLAVAAQILADWKPRWRWPQKIAAGAQIPAAVTGAGLATYTASLLSATSTPFWAAAPRPLAVRFAASAIASGTAALALGERAPGTRRALDGLLLAALTTELLADTAASQRYRETGVAAARDSRWGQTERIAGNGLGVLLPIGLLIASRLVERRPGPLAAGAHLAALGGSAAMRIAVLGVGVESAKRPEISLRFSQPKTLR